MNAQEELKQTKKSLFDKEFYVRLIRIISSCLLMLIGYFWLNEARVGVYWNFAIMFITWVIVGYDVAYKAFKNLFSGHNPFDENFLMLLASIGAFCLRFFGVESNEFLEAVMVMLLFQIGEMFEDVATKRSHDAITNAVALRAPFAHLVKDGYVKEVKPETLAVDDLVIVKVGEILPADGIIENGEGYVDLSSLTGEPVPVHKTVGEPVNSGTILRKGSFTVRVNKEYENSTVSKILKLVEDGTKSKTKADRFVDKFARIYTPIVVGLAILVAIIPPLFLGVSSMSVWEKWIYTSLSFLVISCPCAIVISVPLAYFAGLGLASKNGILIKGAGFFDQLNRLGLVVTDKTGTLTYGDFKVTKVAPAGIVEDEFLLDLKAAESRSNHPIASAIIGKEDVSSLAIKVKDYTEIAGEGISCTYEGKKLLSGNEKLLRNNGIDFTPSEDTGSIVYLAVDGRFAGYLVCSDVIREKSLKMVQGLKTFGVKTCMLTGDKEKTASMVARKLGLDEYHAELLPDEKVKILKSKINPKGEAVAYMGDGINDAPSITLADVGVAMGGVGSDLAIENADVVIMDDNPDKLVGSLKIAHATRNHVMFNIIAALVVKLSIMVCASVIEGFPLLVAVLGDTGLTLLLVLNSVSLLKSHCLRTNSK